MGLYGLQVSAVGLFLLLSSVTCNDASNTASVERFLDKSYAAGIINSTQLMQLKTLAKSDESLGEAEREALPQESGIFMRMYGQFTLLNVLYFGGALLIMGAYTLFMTIAWERCGGDGITIVITMQAVAFGAAGLTLWEIEDYQFLGGILCTVSTSMVAYAVYGIQRFTGLWPRDDPGIFQGFRMYIHSGWIVMEVVTILCGLFYFALAPFPFLMFPVSFCIWFLSMDICPLIKGWPNNFFEIRRNVSVVVGLLTMASAYLLECSMGANPDYAFWLYLFGLLTFWSALTFSHSGNDVTASLYLLINISLCVVGSQLDRTTFHVFGTLGVILYTCACTSGAVRSEKWFALWILKAVAAATLFAQAARSGGNFEIVGGLFCLAVFNFTSILFLASSERYYILVLATNLGFVAAATAFQRPIYLWFFTIDGEYLDVVGGLCCLVVTLYHGGIIWYAMPPNRMTSWNQYEKHAYHLYRIVASVLLSFCFALLGHPGLAFLGALGIPIVSFNYNVGHELSFRIVSVLLLVFGIYFSNFLESNALYLLCCVLLLTIMMKFLEGYRSTNMLMKTVGCALSVGLALLSIPIHSRFMITIAIIYIFCYLSYLAYQVFKNSLFFPLVLVLLGGSIIYSGVMYQRSEDKIQGAVADHMPRVLAALLSNSIHSDWGLPNWSASIAQSRFTWDSFREAPANWILWSGALSYSLSKGKAPYIPAVCALGIVMVGVTLLMLKLKQLWTLDLSSSIEVKKFSAKLSTDPAHNGHGMIIELEGTKPSDLKMPVHVAFTIQDGEFWSRLDAVFGQWAVGMARSMFLPYRLTPHLITFEGFRKGSTSFKATIRLGTGHKGSHKMKHTTVTNNLRRIDGSAAVMSCALMYSNAWYQPYSTLCVERLTVNEFGKDMLNAQ